MAARRQWSDLSERTRRLLVTAAVAEVVLKAAALADLIGGVSGARPAQESGRARGAVRGRPRCLATRRWPV